MIKALGTLATLAAIALGLYFAPQAIASHTSGQTQSYVSVSTLDAKLARNAHSLASHAGAFRESADISGANVESAHQTEVN